MPWLLLADGVPDATDDPWEEPARIPWPFDLFRALYQELAATDVVPFTTVDHQVEPREEELVHGFHGTPEIGVWSTEHRSLWSKMFPVELRYATYGLPGIAVIWEYHWHYAGQAGHSIFKHRTLRAQFATPAAQADFERIWHATFGKRPVFEPLPEETP